ncbi:aldehyde ferredoxin oxidoreductase family protein [Wukongibacter baidiensis]|uniref:aldehyde ferredoxin oxidoreductase family protein n=1 Tax=Wukongibacter baidiensis TaxID=1723361 RepID=UPI003D7F9F1C
MYGYAGKFLDINLTSLEVKELKLDGELLNKYISGVGISTKLIYDNIEPDTDPLGPQNVLCFAVGVFVGTNVPTACRTEASAKSPLTGLIGTSNSGNFWGSELKYAGYDGMILRGRSETPVYISISNDDVKILPADSLWGKDSWDTIDHIRKEFHDNEIQIATIGQAGENLCRFASIQNGPHDAWGRTGLGAVMGSKNLKAIAVRGTNGIKVFDKKEFLESVKECYKVIYESPFYGPFSKYGTMLATAPYFKFGALPGRNFQTGIIQNWMETRSYKLVDKYSNRGIACISCPISCAHWVEVEEGPYSGLKVKDMEVTPVIGFGAGCDINNIPAAAKLCEVCQRYGVDMISASSTIAFAMELYQRGILTEEQIGFSLHWGDEEASFKLLELIMRREGIGDILAEGTKRAGEKISGADYYAMHVKGLEIPMADARGRWSTWTFGNLTNIRGGDHLRNRNPVENLRYNLNTVEYKTEKFGFPDKVYNELDMPEEVKKQIFNDKDRDVDIPKMSKWSEDLISVYNTVGICIRPPILNTVGPSLIARLYTSLTGIKMTPDEIMKVGERIWNLQKLFNLREGEVKEDSVYPERFYDEVLPEGPSRGKSLSREKVIETLEEYYDYRGWDKENGVPSSKKLEELEL